MIKFLFSLFKSQSNSTRPVDERLKRLINMPPPSSKLYLNDIDSSRPEHITLNSTHSSPDFDINSSAVFATKEQHEALKNYFRLKGVLVQFNYESVNMTGFFDEAAEVLIHNAQLMDKIVGQIRWAYRKSVNNIKIVLDNYSKPEQKQIRQILEKLYKYTVFARYSFDKTNNVVWLSRQESKTVEQFFRGDYLEWFVLSRVLKFAKKHKIALSISRNALIKLQNHKKYELDVAFICENRQPVFIECKSGNYRTDFGKYQEIRKQFNLPEENVILLNLETTQSEENALTMMHHITVCSVESLEEHLSKVML